MLVLRADGQYSYARADVPTKVKLAETALIQLVPRCLNPVAKRSNPIYNISMNFGPVDPELRAGAKNAIETCLSVQSGENVALIFDRESEAVAAVWLRR